MNDLVITYNTPLETIGPVDQNPVNVYLAGLGSGSRRAMIQTLDTVAQIITNNDEAVAMACPGGISVTSM